MAERCLQQTGVTPELGRAAVDERTPEAAPLYAHFLLELEEDMGWADEPVFM
jgi:hypothetical protein